MDGLDEAGRRRLRRAWVEGAAHPGRLLWVLTIGRFDPLQVHYFDDFYDAQARLLMHGRPDVPAEVPGFEGFLIDGKTATSTSGPWPAGLRMPVLAVTDRFDGRLTTLSMLLAAVASPWRRSACSAACGASCGAPALSAGANSATGLAAVVVLVAPPFFLASQAWCTTGDAWGIALTVAGSMPWCAGSAGRPSGGWWCPAPRAGGRAHPPARAGAARGAGAEWPGRGVHLSARARPDAAVVGWPRAVRDLVLGPAVARWCPSRSRSL